MEGGVDRLGLPEALVGSCAEGVAATLGPVLRPAPI